MHAAGTVLDDGTIAEIVYSPAEDRTRFAVWRQDSGSGGSLWTLEPSLGDSENRIVPFSARNNLIHHGAILLPEQPAEYGSAEDLAAALQAYIHRYVEVSPAFERLASYYVLLSWVYDAFVELPYLRVRGDYGSGKTRCLLVVGSICYRPFFASGASTISPIFHTLDAFRGTLVMDEADFRFSDEKAEITKIFNNGNVKGMPVLRTVIGTKGEYDPRAFQVFGPKLIATRGYYEDRALESRFLTEDMGGEQRLRDDIPISLPRTQREEAAQLRNQLLLFRFRTLGSVRTASEPLDDTVEPRLNQIIAPLLSVAPGTAAREELRSIARRHQDEMVAERAMEIEAQLLEVVRELAADADGRRETLPLKDIVVAYLRRFGQSAADRVTSRSIGTTLRRSLGFRTRKSHGNFVVVLPGPDRLERLCRKYGLDSAVPDDAGQQQRVDSVDRVDMGDIPAGPMGAP